MVGLSQMPVARTASRTYLVYLVLCACMLLSRRLAVGEPAEADQPRARQAQRIGPTCSNRRWLIKRIQVSGAAGRSGIAWRSVTQDCQSLAGHRQIVGRGTHACPPRYEINERNEISPAYGRRSVLRYPRAQYDRNERNEISPLRRMPDLPWAPAGVAVLRAAHKAGRQDQPERPVNARLGQVAAEEIDDVVATERTAPAESGQDRVCRRIAEAVVEDPAG